MHAKKCEWQADVMYMSHGLTVLDFFKKVSARKVQEKILKDGKSRGKFLIWAKNCEHYSRRAGLKTDWTIFFRRPDERHNGNVP
jgi:hypothetical protein